MGWEQYRVRVSAAAETFIAPTIFAWHSAASVGRIPTIGLRREGLLVTGRLRTVVDLAAFSPFVEAVAPVDHVLKPDVAQGLPALTKEQLLAGIEGSYAAAAARRIRAAISERPDHLAGRRR